MWRVWGQANADNEERFRAKVFEQTRFNQIHRLVSTGGILQAPRGTRGTEPPPPGEEIFFDLAILFHRRDSCTAKQLRTHLFDREQNQNNKGLECQRQISKSGPGPIGPGFSPEQRSCRCTLKFLHRTQTRYRYPHISIYLSESLVVSPAPFFQEHLDSQQWLPGLSAGSGHRPSCKSDSGMSMSSGVPQTMPSTA